MWKSFPSSEKGASHQVLPGLLFCRPFHYSETPRTASDTSLRDAYWSAVSGGKEIGTILCYWKDRGEHQVCPAITFPISPGLWSPFWLPWGFFLLLHCHQCEKPRMDDKQVAVLGSESSSNVTYPGPRAVTDLVMGWFWWAYWAISPMYPKTWMNMC